MHLQKEEIMEYRTLPHGGEKISVIGLGAGGLHNAGPKEIERTIEAAIDAGVNFFDFVATNDTPFEPMGRAVGRHRSDVHLQVHLGADFSRHAYAWTTDAKVAIAEFERRLAVPGVGYADFGFIHCIDESADLDRVLNGGIWEYALRQRDAGVIRHLGFSTHSVHIARRLLATGEMDLGMLSLNPMYDYTDESEYGKGEAADRMELLLATSWRRSTTATSSTMRGSAWGAATATVAAPLAWRSPRACARSPRILACDAGEKGQAERARAYVRRLSRNRLAAREVVAVRFQTTSMMETAGG